MVVIGHFHLLYIVFAIVQLIAPTPLFPISFLEANPTFGMACRYAITRKGKLLGRKMKMFRSSCYPKFLTDYTE